ncbi:MAG: hypothetical protein NZ519_03415 [Bacteroidia bacterium]|nr:hypothetical protein [Bacteroidia bacterium]MDW8301119.1 hypothetical protein [Bacteroidia bacterium]
MKKCLIIIVVINLHAIGFSQNYYADSLIQFVLVKNNKDTIKNESSLTWQDLHSVKAKIRLHSLTAQYGVTHPKGIMEIEIFCNVRTGWNSVGITEIPFTLSASVLSEPIAIYSYLKMKHASGKIQVRLKKITLYSLVDNSSNIELYFSENRSVFFTLVGKDSTW